MIRAFAPSPPTRLTEVRRLVETLQFIHGFSTQGGSGCFRYHANGLRNGTFVDAHADRSTTAEWYRAGQDR